MVGSEDGQSARLAQGVSEPLTLASQPLCSREEDGTAILEGEPASLMPLSASLCKGTVGLSRRADLVPAHLLRAGPWALLSFPGA